MNDHRTFPPLRLPRRERDGSRTWRPEDVVRCVTHQTEFAAAMLPAAQEVITRANRDSDDGVASANHDGSPGPLGDDGSSNGRTPNLVLSKELLGSGKTLDEQKHLGWREEPVRAAMKTMVKAIVEIDYYQRRLSQAFAVLQTLDAEDARKLVEERRVERGQFCENPNHNDRWVSGAAGDKIRAGRCEACGKHKQRYGSDRSREMIEKAEGKGEAA